MIVVAAPVGAWSCLRTLLSLNKPLDLAHLLQIFREEKYGRDREIILVIIDHYGRYDGSVDAVNKLRRSAGLAARFSIQGITR